MSYVIFALLAIIAVILLCCIRLADLADERRMPTRRQRREWDRDRADLNPALRRR